LVVGEPQVLGQVKDAYNVAAEAGCTGLLLNKLFHSAFVAGKRVRTETALSEGAVSVSYAAVALARKIFGDLKGRTVLVLGAGELEEVFLYNIDDLQTVVQENLSRRATEASQAEAIVAEEVNRFTAWVNSRGAVPTVVALRQRFEAVRQSELRRLEPKLSGLSPDARAKVDEVTRLIVEKLLINPTEQLKSISDADTVAAYSDALTRLFDLAGVSDELTAAGRLRQGFGEPRQSEATAGKKRLP